ncbi:MAG: hypothetical protein FJW09_00980 [Actinobacteria bacterium]|nr:hypothetical protein [Actinomycetota bacterium]
MTIGKGVDWGVDGEMPADVIVCDTDRTLSMALRDGREAVVVGGDMATTIGARRVAEIGRTGRRLPVDLLDVELIHRDRHRVCVAASHVMIHGARRRGGPLRGEVYWVMNSQYYDGRDLVPRGHPNDGRLEVLSVDPRMGLRQRLLAWSRARTGRHLPHPCLSVRSTTEVAIECAGAVVLVDGVGVGRADSVRVRVRADGGAIWI